MAKPQVASNNTVGGSGELQLVPAFSEHYHDSDGDDPINRLLRRDLVSNLGPSHRYALYAWQEPEPEADGYWHPAGHP